MAVEMQPEAEEEVGLQVEGRQKTQRGGGSVVRWDKSSRD